MSQIKGKQVQPASLTSSGVLTSAAQTVFGQKTFNSNAAQTVSIESLQNLVGTVGNYVSSGTPEGVVSASIGSKCYDITNGLEYFKQSGIGNTGWVSRVGTLVLAANQTSLNTTLVSLTGMTVNIPAGRRCHCSVKLFWTSSLTTRSLNAGVTSTGTLNAGEFMVGAGVNGTAYHSGYQIAALNTRVGPTTTTTVTGRVSWLDFLITAAGAATATPQFSNSNTTGTITVLAGSYMDYKILG